MDKFLILMYIVLVGLVILAVLNVAGLFIDTTYVKPVADMKANDYCKSLGFDQYKTYSREGLFSNTPVAIKCEYAEKYTDLGIRT